MTSEESEQMWEARVDAAGECFQGLIDRAEEADQPNLRKRFASQVAVLLSDRASDDLREGTLDEAILMLKGLGATDAQLAKITEDYPG